MNRNNLNKMVRDSLANFAINTGARIQKRRQQKNKRQLVSVNIGNAQRRPQGLGRNGGINPRTAMRTVVNNVGTTVSEMQSNAPKSVVGTENIGELYSDKTVDDIFTICFSASLNPAEPGLAPMLSAAVNQFQRFNTSPLKLTYTPTASSATDGTLYIAVYPDPQTPDPTTYQEMVSTGSTRSFPVYGSSQTWTIPNSSIQQSYKIQQVTVNTDVTDDTPLCSSGKVLVACKGVAKDKLIGTLAWTYNYKMSLNKLTTGSNSANSHYGVVDITNQGIKLTKATLIRGLHTLVEQDTVGDYKMRLPQSSHFLFLRTEGAAAASVQTVSRSDNGTDWTVVAAVHNLTTGNFWEAAYYLPPCRFVRLRNAANTHLVGGYAHLCSLREDRL